MKAQDLLKKAEKSAKDAKDARTAAEDADSVAVAHAKANEADRAWSTARDLVLESEKLEAASEDKAASDMWKKYEMHLQEPLFREAVSQVKVYTAQVRLQATAAETDKKGAARAALLAAVGPYLAKMCAVGPHRGLAHFS